MRGRNPSTTLTFAILRPWWALPLRRRCSNPFTASLTVARRRSPLRRVSIFRRCIVTVRGASDVRDSLLLLRCLSILASTFNTATARSVPFRDMTATAWATSEVSERGTSARRHDSFTFDTAITARDCFRSKTNSRQARHIAAFQQLVLPTYPPRLNANAGTC